MPHFDGVALTRALKRIDADVRIIATSGHSDDSRIAALKELSVRAFLTKPYAADNLLSVLHDALAVSQ
jgi:DNA-binding NarL/FixJ family response regulator